MPLSELENGSVGIIDENRLTGGIRQRLYDLGFCDGGVVECVGESMFKNPRAYLIKGSVFAIRNEDAKRIILRVNE